MGTITGSRKAKGTRKGAVGAWDLPVRSQITEEDVCDLLGASHREIQDTLDYKRQASDPLAWAFQ